MFRQTVELAPGESQEVAFETIPHEARAYQVSVDGLSGTLEARPLPTSTLEGRVTDAETGFPIENVKVTANGLTAYTAHYRPDVGYGSYQFEGLESGEYTVSFERFGYEPVTLTKTLYGGENQLDIEMIPLSPELLPIQIVDLDSNNNEVVDSEDEAMFLAAYGSIEGEPNYDRQFDANFDGVIDNWDYNIFYQTLGKDLNVIRNSIKTGIYEHLVWPDGWDAYLVALNKDMVEEFTGLGKKCGLAKDGWISVQHHPYIYPDYVCEHFAADTAVAAYKALGYGCLLYAETGLVHGYDMFWVGGDWRDLNNWYILEPQDGKIFCAAQPELPSKYRTTHISFPDTSCKYVLKGYSPGWQFSYLSVDYDLKRVNYGETHIMGCHHIHASREEPWPDIFNRAYLVGV